LRGRLSEIDEIEIEMENGDRSDEFKLDALAVIEAIEKEMADLESMGLE
jgi:hypothetical protein